MDTGKYQNDIDLLTDLELYRYENIFKVYETTGSKNFFYYNILKRINLPDNINETLFDTIEIPREMPLTTLSFRIYGITYLWWFIMVLNNIKNPAKIPEGKQIRIIKKQYLKTVLEDIKKQLN